MKTKPTSAEQLQGNFFYGLSYTNEHKDTFGDKISKEEALVILKNRKISSTTIEAIRQEEVEVRAFAKPWLKEADNRFSQLYFFVK